MRQMAFARTRLVAAVGMVSLLATPILALAQSPGTDKQSSGQFTAIALITDDLDWYEIFRRPEVPNLSLKEKFGAGERGALAIFFSNPEPHRGKVKVLCDVTAFDPGGSKTVVKSAVCYEGPYLGDNFLHPALLDIQFEGGPDDPSGPAGFRIKAVDAQSKRSVRLTVGYMQVGGK